MNNRVIFALLLEQTAMMRTMNTSKVCNVSITLELNQSTKFAIQ